MKLQLNYQDGGVAEQLEVAIDALSDLRPIFARYLAWLRPQIEQEFQTRGDGQWPELKVSSKEERARTLPAKAAQIRARALNPLQRSVLRTSARAEKRFAKTKSDSKLYARRQKTVEKQRRQADEIRRVNAGGPSSNAREFSKLGQRVEKYKAKAEATVQALERGELLGRIANSIRSEIDKGSLTLESAIAWAGVHNEGGTAGKGARIPKRTFLEWTPERIEKFVEIAQAYMLEKLDNAAKGAA